MFPCAGDSSPRKTCVQPKQQTAGRLSSFHIWGGKNNDDSVSEGKRPLIHQLQVCTLILPSVSYEEDRLAEPEGPSHQHRQPPHAVCPHHVAKLLWNASDAVDEGTCQSEHRADITLSSNTLDTVGLHHRCQTRGPRAKSMVHRIHF